MSKLKIAINIMYMPIKILMFIIIFFLSIFCGIIEVFANIIRFLGVFMILVVLFMKNDNFEARCVMLFLGIVFSLSTQIIVFIIGVLGYLKNYTPFPKEKELEKKELEIICEENNEKEDISDLEKLNTNEQELIRKIAEENLLKREKISKDFLNKIKEKSEESYENLMSKYINELI